MSKAIIRPSTMPSRIAFDPLMLFSPSSSALIRLPMGLPSTMIMTSPQMMQVSSGITSTGIRPRAQAGTFQPVIQCATTPASTPPRMAPRKPVAGRLTGFCAAPSVTLNTLIASPPITKPGAMPGRSAMA